MGYKLTCSGENEYCICARFFVVVHGQPVVKILVVRIYFLVVPGARATNLARTDICIVQEPEDIPKLGLLSKQIEYNHQKG